MLAGLVGCRYSFNRTCWYEVSYIHPRIKQPLGERLGRAALDL